MSKNLETQINEIIAALNKKGRLKPFLKASFEAQKLIPNGNTTILTWQQKMNLASKAGFMNVALGTIHQNTINTIFENLQSTDPQIKKNTFITLIRSLQNNPEFIDNLINTLTSKENKLNILSLNEIKNSEYKQFVEKILNDKTILNFIFVIAKNPNLQNCVIQTLDYKEKPSRDTLKELALNFSEMLFIGKTNIHIEPIIKSLFSKEYKDIILRLNAVKDGEYKELDTDLFNDTNKQNFIFATLKKITSQDNEKNLSLITNLINKAFNYIQFQNSEIANDLLKDLIKSATNIILSSDIKEHIPALVDKKLLLQLASTLKISNELTSILTSNEQNIKNIIAVITKSPNLEMLIDKALNYNADPKNPNNLKELTEIGKKIFLSPEIREHITSIMQNLLSPETKTNLLEFINPDLIKTTLKLTNLNIEKSKLNNLINSITSDSENFIKLTNALIDFSQSKKISDDLKKSALDIISPEIIASSIALINPNLIENLLPIINISETQENSIEEINGNIAFCKQAAQIISDNNKLNEAEQKILDPIITSNIPTKNNEQASFGEDIKQAMKVATKMGIAQKIKTFGGKKQILEAIYNNKENLVNSLNLVKDKNIPPIAKILNDYDFEPKEIISLLPNILTLKGTRAIAKFIEKPTILNAINMLNKTESRLFALKQLVKIFKNNIKKYYNHIVGNHKENLSQNIQGNWSNKENFRKQNPTSGLSKT